MTTIRVDLAARSYDVVVEAGLFGRLGERLKPLARGGRLIVVTDENVWNALGYGVATSIADAGVEPEIVLLPPGEATKSWDHLIALLDRLLALEVERSDHIVALGGGVIGDLVGFAASLLKRGCKFVQLPTTLLAQVDSSVGGKTAINVPAGKNLIGAFHQPSLVLIDPDCLDTLPAREVRAGYAEVVKYGLLGDAAFFDWCEANARALLSGDADARAYAIAKSVQAKAEIVAADERETQDKRALLNLGHTFGHALEAETGYSDRLLHGEGVALGMVLALRFSAERGLMSGQDAERAALHIAASGLPATLADAGIDAPGSRLADHMRHDKKASGGTIPFILARGIGQAFVDKTVALEDVAAFLDRQREVITA